MARIKGAMGAKKRHNRTLKLAKGYYGARSKQYRIAKQTVMKALTAFQRLCRPQAEEETVPLPVDRPHQCGGPSERPVLQQDDARPEACRRRP